MQSNLQNILTTLDEIKMATNSANAQREVLLASTPINASFRIIVWEFEENKQVMFFASTITKYTFWKQVYGNNEYVVDCLLHAFPHIGVIHDKRLPCTHVEPHEEYPLAA